MDLDTLEKCDLSQVELIDINKGSADQPSNNPGHDVSKQLQVVMENDMDHLCHGLSDSTQKFKGSIEGWLTGLDEYIEKYGRLLYSSISNYIYELDEKKYATFELNIYSVLEYVMNTPDSTDPEQNAILVKRKKYVLKFYDHVNLAHKQFVLYSGKQANLEKLIEAQIEPKLAESSKELTSQLVGMVAIFTALSFIVFGGISSLESLFSKLPCNTDTVLPIIIIALAWTLCIGNLLFAFMYFVLHIIGITPDLSAKRGNLIQKYPLVFLTNYVLISGLLVSSAAMAAKVHGIGKGIYSFVLSHNDCVFIIVLLFIIGIIIAAGRLLLWLYKKTNLIDNV